MYIFFIGLLAAPLVSIASIGTQITEAFAGLDRIREILDMETEDEVGRRQGRRSAPIQRRHPLRGRLVRVQPGPAGAEGRHLPRRAGDHDRAGRVERLGQEHAHQPGDGLQPAAEGARAGRRPRPRRTIPLRDYREQLASVLQENFLFDGTIADNIGYAKPGADAGRDQARGAGRPLRGVHPPLPRGLRHDRRRARHQAVRRPAPARVDCARHPGRAARPDPRRGDLEPRQRERGDDPGRAERRCARAAPRSSSPTGCRRSAAPTRFW